MTSRDTLGVLGTFVILCAAVGIGGDSLMSAGIGWSGAFIGLCAVLVLAWWVLLFLLFGWTPGNGGGGGGKDPRPVDPPPPGGRECDAFLGSDDWMALADGLKVYDPVTAEVQRLEAMWTRS
jgi:hypothetical protein